MERPTVLLVIDDVGDAYVDALRRAGFEPVIVDPAHVLDVPPADIGVVDCDLPPEVVTAVYWQLHPAKAPAPLLLVGSSTNLPQGVGGPGDEVALKPMPPDSLV